MTLPKHFFVTADLEIILPVGEIMSILRPEELEKCLFDAINNCYKSGGALSAHDFFSHMLQYFNCDYERYRKFLSPLSECGYIQCEGPMGQVIRFGDKAMEWRERLEQAFSSHNQQIANQTFNITNAQNVQAAGHDINIILTESDAENIVQILRDIVTHSHENTGLITNVKDILSCGASALEILKRIAGIII